MQVRPPDLGGASSKTNRYSGKPWRLFLMNILHIDCSPRPESHSRKLSAAIVDKLLEASPAARVSRRDLGAAPLPHAAPDYATALSSPVTLAAPPRGALDLAESLIQEVE